METQKHENGWSDIFSLDCSLLSRIIIVRIGFVAFVPMAPRYVTPGSCFFFFFFLPKGRSFVANQCSSTKVWRKLPDSLSGQSE